MSHTILTERDALARHRADVYHARLRATQQAVADERLRIARDLHDVVAHGMSMIAVQSAYGHYVFADHPEQAQSALSTIETTSRQVLAEMRHLVGALRPSPTDPRQACTAPTQPVAGLADLPQLVAATTGAGVQIELQHHGDPVRLPPGADLTAYRIIQESLSNVIQHAGPTSCRIDLHHRPDALTIEIIDAGPATRAHAPPHPGPAGHGLTGMRERVSLYHGRLDAGSTPDGGYRISVHLPFAEPAR